MTEEEHSPKLLNKIKNYYIHNYKKLLIIPFLLLFLAILQIGYQYATEGEMIHRGISLKGGVALNIQLPNEIDIPALENFLKAQLPENEINVRTVSQAGSFKGIIIEADIELDNNEKISLLKESVKKNLQMDLDITQEGIDSSLSASFFREIIIAITIAFLFMAVVVFIYFRSIGPSLAVVLAALSDIIITISILNILNIKLSTGGLVALLLLIGYSVDTDILLSTKLLKRKEGTMIDRLFEAMRTGLTMTATTLTAVIVAIIFTQSFIIKQIMTIILIGLLVDLINTWIQNVGLLRIFIEKGKK